jgi:hypothetical protein
LVTKDEYKAFLDMITPYFLRKLLLAIPYGARKQVQQNLINSFAPILDDSFVKFDADGNGKLNSAEFFNAMRD